MKKLLIIVLLIASTSINAQAKADSINKRIADSIDNLVLTKMVITYADFDSTMDRIKSILTVKEFEKWNGAYQFFMGQMVNYWLIKNGELKKKK